MTRQIDRWWTTTWDKLLPGDYVKDPRGRVWAVGAVIEVKDDRPALNWIIKGPEPSGSHKVHVRLVAQDRGQVWTERDATESVSAARVPPDPNKPSKSLEEIVSIFAQGGIDASVINS